MTRSSWTSRGARAAAWACSALLAVSMADCDPEGYVDPRPPEDVASRPVPLPHLPLSTINVAMTIPVSSLVQLVDEAVPRRYGDLDEFQAPRDGGHVSVAFELERSPFRAVVVDDVARLSATILYRVRVHYSLPVLPDIESSCGVGDEPRPALTVSIESPLALARDWSLRTHARVADLGPASSFDMDRCTVTALGIDVTDRIVADAGEFLQAHLAAIDSLAAQVDTRSQFASWWTTLREPVELSDSLWLAMDPEAVTQGPLRGSGDSLTVQLGLQSRPQIVFGDRPDLPSKALPPLDSGTVKPGLDLRVDARLEYGAASRLLEEALGGRRIYMGGRSIQVDSVQVYGMDSGRLAMRLSVSGDLRGQLYLTGRPTISAVSGRVSVPDLEVDVATRDVVVSAASWFAAPVLSDYLRQRATWPTAPAVDWLTMWLERGLNRDIAEGLRVKGVVEDIRIVGAEASPDALWVRLAARGSASLFVQN